LRWHKPSAAGRRVALDRKFAINVAHYGGPIKLVTITPPGVDLLPWDDSGRKVEWIYLAIWETTAQRRMSRLFEAAQVAADRMLRRAYGKSVPLPRQIANVRAPQKRGVSHWHYALPMGSEIEKAWSRTVYKFLRAVANREQSVPADDRFAALEREYMTGEVTKGFYGVGFVQSGNKHGGSSWKAARYLARNAAGYLGENAADGRHYVSVRLVRETGATMRALRACNYLWVRMREGIEPVVPESWSEEWRAEVTRVFALTTRAASGL
jgi:hypothetical protein